MACPWSFVDQSTLARKSMPPTKKPGDEVFFGSTCKQGKIEIVVITTSVHTFLGKVVHLVDSTNNVGHFQKGFFIVCVSSYHYFYLHWHVPPSLYGFHFFYLGHVKHDDQRFYGFL